MARNKGQITGLRNTLSNLSSLGQAWTFDASSDGMKMKNICEAVVWLQPTDTIICSPHTTVESNASTKMLLFS